jgi:hypothetical protein
MSFPQHRPPGRFEAGAVNCGPRGALGRRLKELRLGWEGAEEPKEEAAEAEEAAVEEAVRAGRQGLAVCLCFEGGPGTIGTIKVKRGKGVCVFWGFCVLQPWATGCSRGL